MVSDQIDPVAALTEEACRIKERLDRLEAIISGTDPGWMDIQLTDGTLEVIVNRPLAEARQQALALRAILAELRAIQGGKTEPAAPAVDVADELGRAREAKRAAAESV